MQALTLMWGESAGGHLADLLGTTGDVPALEGNSGSGGLSSRVQAVFAIASDRDDTVLIERSESVYRALRAVGADATFVPVPGADRRLALRDRSR